MKLPGNLHLDFIAATLEGFEENIIYSLLDRVQYCTNTVIYKEGKSGFAGELNKSLFSIRLRSQEEMDARFGRFFVAEERPFTRRLPRSRRTTRPAKTGLAITDFNLINLTPEILDSYLKLVSRMCRRGDDRHYGSSVEHDVSALQAISRRIHYGAMYVAESKYRSNPVQWEDLIKAHDAAGLLTLLTRKKVEERIINRIRQKVVFIQKHVNLKVRCKIDPDTVVRYYRDTIIPLTKQGEIMYLLKRDSRKP